MTAQTSVQNPLPFFVKDCVLSTISTGEHAGNLIEFRDKLLTIHEGCIYHHFWGGHLRPMFIDPEYQNDFAVWAHRALHDNILAERLGIIDPTQFRSQDDLRGAVIEVVENRLDESEEINNLKINAHFYFVRSKIIIFTTPVQINTPLDLIKIVPFMSTHSIFYHFIDARRRSNEEWDDFSLWLQSYGNEFQELISQIRSVDPYFFTLPQLKKELIKVVQKYFISES